MNTAMEVATCIKGAMRAAERSPSWVSRKAAIALTTLNRKLDGGADFTVGEVHRIATALGVPAAALLPVEFLAGAESQAVA